MDTPMIALALAVAVAGLVPCAVLGIRGDARDRSFAGRAATAVGVLAALIVARACGPLARSVQVSAILAGVCLAASLSPTSARSS